MKFEIMDWSLCESRFVRNINVDEYRIKSIIKCAMKRLKRAGREEDISFIVEDYYETIKELLVAYLLKNGLKSTNHQCLISYFLKENPEYFFEAEIIQKMSFFRNMLNYYGEDVPVEFYKKNKGEFKKIVELILGLLGVKNG